MVVEYLLSYFHTHIHILEAAPYNNQFLKRMLPQNVTFTFIEDHDPVFYRTKYINQLIKHCSTPFTAIWDADVIVPPDQIIQSMELLRKQKADFVSPFKNEAYVELRRKRYKPPDRGQNVLNLGSFYLDFTKKL